MSKIDDSTPVIVGVGEASERIGEPSYRALSPADLAGAAAAKASEDALPGGVAAHIDVIAAIRQFEISTPYAKAPFGCSNNLPRSIGKRIGANPKRAILEITGGQGPQHLVNELAASIARGETTMALLVGSESISTMRDLLAKGEKTDWSETVEGDLEDRGYGLEGMSEPTCGRHGMIAPMYYYAAFENARRGRLGLSRAAYAKEMGALFAPFTEVAAKNEHAMARETRSADELTTPTPRNRLVADPYTRFVVSRDQANQGAAVILTSVGKARALGIPEEKFVYLHSYVDVKERTVLERQDLSASPASIAAMKQALATAGKTADQIDVFDLYSCFPIAVFNICDGLGLSPTDSRGLTVTGGLPFFGGAGNNYSMHAVAEIVEKLRAKPGSFGLLGANGGFLSKYSAGVYSTTPAPFTERSSKALQAEIDGWEKPVLDDKPNGAATIETFTIDYGKPDAPKPIVIGRLNATGARFIATIAPDDAETAQKMIATDPLGAAIVATAGEKVNTFKLA